MLENALAEYGYVAAMVGCFIGGETVHAATATNASARMFTACHLESEKEPGTWR
jgi:hypothetical protein